MKRKPKGDVLDQRIEEYLQRVYNESPVGTIMVLGHPTWLTKTLREFAEQELTTAPPSHYCVWTQDPTHALRFFIAACGLHAGSMNNFGLPGDDVDLQYCSRCGRRIFLEGFHDPDVLEREKAAQQEEEKECTCSGGPQGEGLVSIPHEPSCPLYEK